MSQHHSENHGEKLHPTIECDACGGEFTVEPHRKDVARFCSDECKGSATGPGANPSTVVCERCGDEYEVTPAREDTTKFCSAECRFEYMSDYMAGGGNPSYKGALKTCECEWCGGEYQEYRPERTRFCSKECFHNWRSEVFRGENHPQYKGVRVDYGPNWPEQSAKARERDDHTCQACGEEHEEGDSKFHVHHITPRRKFVDDNGELDYERANRLGNLTTLCWSCHPKWEGVGLVPDTR